MSEFYTIEKPRHRWGDCYNILMHGMSCHLDRADGKIQLERTGPFVPPISLPGISDIVVTDAFRQKLETSGLEGLRYQAIIKKLIVKSDWHTWDLQASKPQVYPDEGEPENYILGQRHSPETSEEMDELWELMLNESARVHRDKKICTREDILLLTQTWEGEDIFRARGVGYIYATKRAKEWLEQHGRQHITFEQAIVAH
jgi:hypothetical protein